MTEQENKTDLKNQKVIKPDIVKEYEEAGIELEKYEEPKGYPKDRNMI